MPHPLNPPGSVAMRFLSGALLGGLLGAMTGWVPALLIDGEVAFGVPYAGWLALCVVAYGVGAAAVGARTHRDSRAARERLLARLEPGEEVAVQFCGAVATHTPGRAFNEWPGVLGEFAVTDRRVLFTPYDGDGRELRGELARLRAVEPAADAPVPPHLSYLVDGVESERLHLVRVPQLSERVIPALRDAVERAAQDRDEV